MAKAKTEQPKKCVEDVLADALTAAYTHRPETEYHFCEIRDWRLDIAYPELKLAIEIDGRYHLSFKRHRQDCEKRNAAKEMGWNVLAYPASVITTIKRLPRVVEQIGRIMHGIVDIDQAIVVCVGD